MVSFSQTALSNSTAAPAPFVGSGSLSDEEDSYLI